MPTSKILYARSNACNKQYPDNTNGNFIYKLKEPITLTSPNRTLAVAIKGIYIPGGFTKHKRARKSIVNVHFNLLDHQQNAQGQEQVLARIGFKQKAGLYHSFETRLLPLNVCSISEFRVVFTRADRNGEQAEFEQEQAESTILQLEITTMNPQTPSFSVLCTCDSSKANSQDSLSGFTARLPTEMNLDKTAYEVGLSSAIIPSFIFAGTERLELTVRAKLLNGDEASLKLHVDDTKLKHIKSVDHLVMCFNFALHKYGFAFLLLITESNRIFLYNGSWENNKKALKKDSTTAKKDWSTVLDSDDFLTFKTFKRKKRSAVPSEPEASTDSNNEQAEEETNEEEINEEEENSEASGTTDLPAGEATGTADSEEKVNAEIVYSHIDVRFSDSLNYVLTGACIPFAHALELSNNFNGIHILPKHRIPDLRRLRPPALVVHSSIVNETVFGSVQSSIMDILPVNYESLHENAEIKVHRPKETTYHDVARTNIQEIRFRVSSILGNPVRDASDLGFSLLLHFKPI